MKNRRSSYPRYLLLGLAAASIIGWGCATPVYLPAAKDKTVDSVFLPAAEKGDAISQLQLALAYRFGTAGAPKDPQSAWKWLNKSADNGLLEAQLMRADALIDGSWDQARQVESGFDALRTIAAQGNRDVQAHLASRLMEGKAFAVDPVEAAKWFERSARAGNRYAAMRLARMYELGQGTSSDAQNAYAWFSIAAANADVKRLEANLGKADLQRAKNRLATLRTEVKR
ncbi:MAG TPA: tetratricopeptide repeat protein [Rhodocyclaceae bacterium]|jgi:TPR repeat protein|nr:tetratricopeptide repeat protein [Rhodocyclaceae bacterium]